MNSIHNISIEANAGQDFYLLLGDFLDEFYKAAPEQKSKMLNDSPEEMGKQELLPFLAATAHKLADDHGLTVPRWVLSGAAICLEPSRFLARRAGQSAPAVHV